MADPFAAFDKDPDTYVSPFGTDDTPRLQQMIASSDTAAGDPFAAFDRDAPEPQQEPEREIVAETETSQQQAPSLVQRMARGLTMPGRGGYALGVAAANLGPDVLQPKRLAARFVEPDEDVSQAAERSSASLKPGFQPRGAEKVLGPVGKFAGDLPLAATIGRAVAPLAAAPVLRAAGAAGRVMGGGIPAVAGRAAVGPASVRALQAATPIAVSGSVGGTIGGIMGTIEDMAAKGEVDMNDVIAAAAGGAVIGAGVHAGANAAISILSSNAAKSTARASGAFFRRALNELEMIKRRYERFVGVGTPENPIVEAPGSVPPDLASAVAAGKVTPQKAATEAAQRFERDLQTQAVTLFNTPEVRAQAVKPAVDLMVKSGIPEEAAWAQASEALEQGLAAQAAQAAAAAERIQAPPMTVVTPGEMEISEVAQEVPAETQAPAAEPIRPEAAALPEPVQRIMAVTGIEDPEIAASLAEPPDSIEPLEGGDTSFSFLEKDPTLAGDLPGVNVPREVPGEALQARVEQAEPDDLLSGFTPDAQQDLPMGDPGQPQAFDRKKAVAEYEANAKTENRDPHYITRLIIKEGRLNLDHLRRGGHIGKGGMSGDIPLYLQTRKGGTTLDKIGSMLQSEGLLPEGYTERDVLDLIDRATRAPKLGWSDPGALKPSAPAAGGGQPPAPPVPPGPPAAPEPGYKGDGEPTPTPGTGVKKQIAKATGLERALPQDPTAAAVRVAKAEATGKGDMRVAELELVHEIEMAKAKEKLAAEKAASIKRSTELREKIKAEQDAGRTERRNAEKLLRHEIKRASVEKKWDQATRSKLVEYISKYLPPDARGKYLSRVAKTNTPKDLTRVFYEVQRDAWAIANQEQIDGIRKLVEKMLDSKSVLVSTKSLVRDLMKEVRAENWSGKTISILHAQQALIDTLRGEGQDVMLAQALKDQLSKLALRPLSDLNPSELSDIKTNLEFLLQQDKDIRQAIEDLNEIQRLEQLQELTKGARKSEFASTKEKAQRGSKDPLTAWAQQMEKAGTFTRAMDAAQEAGIYISPIQAIVDDEGEAARRILFEPLQDGTIAALHETRKVMEIAKRYAEETGGGLTNKEGIRVTIVFMREQTNGREKLHQRGLSDEQIDAVKLTDREKAGLKLREYFNTPEIKAALAHRSAKLYNKEFVPEDNYWPQMEDFQAAAEKGRAAIDIIADQLEMRRKNVKRGFIEKRKEGAKQQIRGDILGVFLDAAKQQIALMHMAEPILHAHNLISDPAYLEAAGDARQAFWKDYLDTLARDGKRPMSRSEWWLDQLRKNIGVGALTFKPHVAAIQFSSLGNAATVVGGENIRLALSASPEWDAFAEKHMPFLDRDGGDPAVREALEGRTAFGAAARAGFAPMIRADHWTARKAALAAYFQYLGEHGLPLDLANPVPQGIRYAQTVIGKTMASPLLLDMPLALSRGGPIVKAFFQFGSESLSKFSILKNQIFGRGKESNQEAAEDLGWMAGAWLYEAGVRMAWIQAAATAMFGIGAISKKQYDKMTDENNKLWKNMAFSALTTVPVVGKVADVIRFQATGLPVADVMTDALQGAYYGTAGTVEGKPYKATRGAINAMSALAMLAGVPAAGLVGWLAKQPFRGVKDKKR